MNSDSQLFYSLKEIIYEIKFELTCYSLKSILSDVHQNPIRFILIKFSLQLSFKIGKKVENCLWNLAKFYQRGREKSE